MVYLILLTVIIFQRGRELNKSYCLLQQLKPGEPLYAQVNREKKKNRGPGGQLESGAAPGPGDMWGYEEQSSLNPPGTTAGPTLSKGMVVDGHGHMAAPAPPGGDSWV